MYLIHHGIKGQRWGVRRYQNKDGTYTSLGKSRLQYRYRTMNASKTRSAVNDILQSMNDQDLEKVLAGDSEYLTFEQGSSVIKRFLKSEKNVPISFFDLLDDGDSINVIVGTRSGNNFRGKGYASEVVSKGTNWMLNNLNKISDKKQAVWGVRTDNIASIKLAEKYGYAIDKNSYGKDKNGHTWVNYVKKLNK